MEGGVQTPMVGAEERNKVENPRNITDFFLCTDHSAIFYQRHGKNRKGMIVQENTVPSDTNAYVS